MDENEVEGNEENPINGINTVKTRILKLHKFLIEVGFCLMFSTCLALLNIIFVVELIICLLVRDKIVCGSTNKPLIDPENWLLIDGLTGTSWVLYRSLGQMFVMRTEAEAAQRTEGDRLVPDMPAYRSYINEWCCSYVFLVLLLFRCSWFIVGAMTYFRDCPELKPSSANRIFLISIIYQLGSVSLTGRL